MRSFVLNRSYMSPNDSYQSFLNTTEFRAAMTPFDPKDYLVAEASLRDIEIFKQIFDFFDLHNQGVLTPMDLRRAFLMFNYKVCIFLFFILKLNKENYFLIFPHTHTQKKIFII